MRVSITGRIGVFLILVGPVLFGCAIRWLAPHPHVVLEMPVSLSPGHISIPTFTVNPDAIYYIDVETAKGFRIPPNCEPRYVLSTQFILSSDDGQVVVRGSSPWEDTGLTIADLYGENRRYSFDADVSPGASCLNAGNPRLKVQTHPYPSDLYVALTWLSVVPVGIGLTLLMRTHISRPCSKIEGPRMFPDMALHNVLPITKLAPLPPIHDPPHWPLFYVAIVSILIFSFVMFGRFPSKGLFVTWKNRDAVVWEKSPWPDTLEVSVRVPSRFFVNGQEVSRSDLHAKLIEQLSRRAEWSVYFEAEPDVAYMEAVYAIETIQACGAKLIWITPKMREDWQQKSKESKPTGRKAEPILRSLPD
jgi:biopolymer transport protein ExbD